MASTIRPDEDINAGWAVTAREYTLIDEVVTQPASPGSDFAIHADPYIGAAQIWGLEDLPDTSGVTVTSITVWAWTQNDITGGPPTIRVKIDGTWTATQTIASGSGWDSYTWTISQAAGAGEIQVEIDTGGLLKNDSLMVDAVYADVTYSISSVPTFASLDPTVLRRGLTDGSGNLKAGLTTDAYSSGTPSGADELNASLVDSSGNLRAGLVNPDGDDLKSSIKASS